VIQQDRKSAFWTIIYRHHLYQTSTRAQAHCSAVAKQNQLCSCCSSAQTASMLQHKLKQAAAVPVSRRSPPARPAAARPRSRLLTARVQAAADLGALDSTSTASSCPFLAPKSSFTDVAAQSQLSQELAGLHGPEGTWRVLPNGNTPQLPEPEGRWAWNPLLGEYGEMERKGMGPFLVERYK
jgi:hypothetical protein